MTTEERIDQLTAERDEFRQSLSRSAQDIVRLEDRLSLVVSERDAALKSLQAWETEFGTKGAKYAAAEFDAECKGREAAKKVCAEMRDAFINIAEYWNGSSEDSAAVDAAEHNRTVARLMLSKPELGNGYRHKSEWYPVVEALRLFAAWRKTARPGLTLEVIEAQCQALAHATKLMEEK